MKSFGLRWPVFRFLVMLALIVIPRSLSASAQDVTPLTPDQPISGQITADTFRQLYTFDAKQGTTIALTLTVTAGSLDPQIILTDPQGDPIQRSLSKGQPPEVSLQAVNLPADGTYFVIVSRFGQDRGTTIGNYTLVLTTLANTANPGVSAAVTTLHYSDQAIGQLGTVAGIPYQFQAQRGDRVTITMQRISDNLDPYLILIDPQGKALIGQDDDPLSPGTLDAAVRNRLITVSGMYQIVATRFGQAAGTSHGTYTLTLTRLSPDSLGLSATTAALLDPGNPIAGSIDATTPSRYYQFNGNKGDLIALDVIRKRGNLNPSLTLTDLNGKPIPKASASGQIGQSATLSPFALPAAGDYLVIVSFQSTIVTAGNFAVTLTTWHGAALDPAGDLTITIGQPVTSILSDAESSHEYLFTGKAGTKVTISMSALDGDLLPSLILETDTRRLLDYNDPGQAGKTAQLKPFTLPADGTYRVIATRHGRAGGATTGLYTLTITRN